MLNLKDRVDVRPGFAGTLIGTNNGNFGSAIGAVIDTMGWSEVMAVLSVGAGYGTSGASVAVRVSIEECAVLDGSTSQWSEIRNGYPCGTFDVGTVHCPNCVGLGGTQSGMYVAKEVCYFNDGNRARYIRAIPTVTATAANGRSIVPVSVVFLLSKPQNSTLIQNAETFGTSGTEYLNRGSMLGTVVSFA